MKKSHSTKIESLRCVVLIVDTQDKTGEKEEFSSLEAAKAFKYGMEFAWEKSRGQYVPDCTEIYCLGDAGDYAAWEYGGAIGMELVYDRI